MSRFTGEYTEDWPEIARQTKEDAGWRCIRCDHPHDPPNGYTLTVHHLNGDKGDNVWFNRAALCQRCHLSIQSRVVMDRMWMLEHSDWFKPYAAGHYARKYLGEVLSREEVEARLGELLALERML